MSTNVEAMEPTITRDYAHISIDEEEEGGLTVTGDEGENSGQGKLDLRFCLVGRFLTDKVINFVAMKNTMASLWRPGKGVCIKDLSPTLFLFQFFHEIDINRVLETGPWTFDQHILLVKRLEEDEQPQNIPLFTTSFWIQIYNLPIGFMSEKILKDIGNYIGVFLASDENNLMGVWRNYMRIRVSMDVRKPLKRRMKLKKAGGDWIWVDFKYERLNIFCFTCGLLGHTAQQCPKLYESPKSEIVPVYGHWLKAPTRRTVMNSGERWLRQGPLEMMETDKGKSPNHAADMPIDLVNATISGVASSKSFVGEGNGGNLTLNMVVDKLLPTGIQLKEKATGGTAVSVDADMAGAEELENGLIINDLKRRRSLNGLHITMGQGDELLTKIDKFEETKNGPVVGPVIQAHRGQ
ncbi:CCHC-type domain-containing protein [Citrus sinensis]|uniref:CCHC-type domain-containing protein n=1 Tax=Citrus sinensis TaxID=2711 RepID=A0ACB8HYN9_CITSI|nr:CCHC-type domain-containing protein [Citrus sinensis]